VSPASDDGAQQWDEFALSHPESRFCHLWGFKKTLQEAYGFAVTYLKLTVSGKLVGVFPSVAFRRSGHLISQPFVEYGGPLVSDLPPAQYVQLPSLLLAEADKAGCGSVLIRGGQGAESLADSPFARREVLQTYGELDLWEKSDPWKAVTHQARNCVKQARKAGLRTEIFSGPQAVAGAFYDLYLGSMKRLSVPPHSKRFFQSLAFNLGDRLVACWAFLGERPVAVLLGGCTQPRIHLFVMASDHRDWKIRPNDLVNWGVIEWASSQGIRHVDFGSASTSEQSRFKQKWGARLLPYAHTYLNRSTKISPSLRNHSRTVFLQKLLWNYLVPVPATKILGPMIRKQLP